MGSVKIQAWRLAAAVLFSVVLAACGGGGGGSGGGGGGSPGSGGTSSSGNTSSTSGATSSTASSGPAVPVSNTDAARFLIQATWGPDMASISNVAANGYARWIDAQFNTPRMDTHYGYVTRGGPVGCSSDATGCDSTYINATMESFWHQVVRGEDQLRQRVAWGLSQIFVTSGTNSPLEADPLAHAGYYDMLSRNAFGNFRNLLQDASTHPAMGLYLSHLRNQPEDPATGRIPDENFAREVMQLFTIGLWELNADGSRRKDGSGNDIPTYVQRDILGMAKVFTGWSWGGGSATYDRWMGWGEGNYGTWNEQMICYDTDGLPFHSRAEKRIINGVVIPASTGCANTLRIALDTLFNHPNVGPFIGSQLIKRLVTSNPSPAYVARVSAVFANNGQGVRGDLRAVIRAILLDTEARDPAKLSDPRWGKLREPVLRFSAWLRAFGASAASGRYRIWNLEDTVSSLGQNPFRAPSVFNWYRPDYSPPGPMRTAGVLGPEFQITHEVTTTGYTNFVIHNVERGHGWNSDGIFANYSQELALATTPAALLDRLNLLLLAGQMSAATRDLILPALSSMPASTQAERQRRVWAAVTLVMASPDFVVQK